MNANEYRAICNALISNHHERLLAEAINRNDANAIAEEIQILKGVKQ